MPTDSKRLPYPEGTQSPYLFLKDKKKTLLIKNVRQDGRNPQDLRPMFLRVGPVTQAKGSCYLEMNRTKIICSVYGPRDIQKRQDFHGEGQLVCEFKYAPFSCLVRRQHQQDSEEKELSAVLKEALEPTVMLYKYPKSTIDVFVMVLENDGSVLSGAITCAGAALVDAGIEMYDVIVGSSLRQCGNVTIVDPTFAEESFATEGDSEHGNVTLGLMPSLQQVAVLLQNGELQPATLSKAVGTLMENCHKIYPLVQHRLLESVKHTLKDKECSKDGAASGETG